ncbi:MAG: hypothetical protein K0S07_173 [Chlamydiales bacterium]|jgi:23S rRNA (uracil1939-C5)-methyltransferase|nr:hypothetical protein [Chlamydiales bacterium]
MKEKRVQFQIDAYDKHGYGLAMVNTIETPSLAAVPFTMPGDVIEGRLYKREKGVYQGALVQIIEPAKERQEAPCSHFGSCGGCLFQHIPEETQLELKEQKIATLFAPYIERGVELHPMIASAPYHYRNKMEFSFSEDRYGERYLGLFLRHWPGRVCHVDDCQLGPSWFMDALSSVRRFWAKTELKAYRPARDEGSLRNLTVRDGDNHRMVILTVSGNPSFALSKEEIALFQETLTADLKVDCELTLVIRIQQLLKGQPTQFFEMFLCGPDALAATLTLEEPVPQSLTFHISPQAFFQPNPVQAVKVYEKALTLAAIEPGDLVFDLYCGTGTISLLAAKLAKRVIGIDLSADSTYDARENSKRLQIGNAEFLTADVGQALLELKKRADYQEPDVVFVDPPRAGLDHKALLEVVSTQAKRIIYISCNPLTQRLNIEEIEKMGYVLKVLQPIDQFPQTVHLENIALLEKRVNSPS